MQNIGWEQLGAESSRLAIFASAGYGAGMALTAAVLARRIRAAIGAAGMQQRELAGIIGIDPSALSKALSGQRNFKPLEVALISDALGVPVQQLLRDEGSGTMEGTTGSITSTLSIGGVTIAARAQPNSSPSVASALDRARLILDLDELLTDVGFPAPPPFRGFRLPAIIAGEAYDQGECLARDLRDLMNLGAGPLPAEIGRLASEIEEKLGVDVVIEPLGPGLDGLAIARGSYRMIMVSSSIPAHRQRYTAGHEVGHLAGQDGDEVVDEDINFGRTPAETRANAFAAAFLMPAAALRQDVLPGTEVDEDLIARLLAKYRVSLDALAFRLHNTGIVDAAGRDRIRRMSSAQIALRHGRASDLQARESLRRPGGLLDRAVRAYSQGTISIRPIADLLGVHPDTLLVELAPPRLDEPGPASAHGSELVPNF
jgi:Zn-dependent peptidase ImmA (M78 family)/transcriptional regulator with XRE-family HTH domain